MTNQAFHEQYVKDLEDAFQQALKNQNFATAIRAKELQARMLDKYNTQQGKSNICLANLTPDDIKTLLQDLEAYPFKNQKHMKAIQTYLKAQFDSTTSS